MKKIIYIITLLMAATLPLGAQEVDSVQNVGPTILPPLFEYPVAPEEIDGWSERNNWLAEHFWEGFDFKQKAVGQAQLNHAFKVYTVPLRFADASVALKSIDNLISKLKKNPGLLLQFTMAAEHNVYDPQSSEAIIDEVYLPFLRAVCADKKLPAIRKVRYKSQLNALENCRTGMPMKSFDFTDRYGASTKYNPVADAYTLIEFGDPGCNECRIMRISMETDPKIKQAADAGKLRIYFIIPDLDEEEGDDWRETVKDYPHFWTVGAGSSLEEQIDLRYTPCMYLIGPDKNIILKNATLEEVHNALSGVTE